MTDSEFLTATLAYSPMIALVIWAFVRRQPRFCAEKLLFFRNRAVAIGVFLITFGALMVFIAWMGYELGECRGGIFAQAKCNRLPDNIGDAMHDLSLGGAIYLVIACLPTLVLLGIIEFITRRKYQRALTSEVAEEQKSRQMKGPNHEHS